MSLEMMMKIDGIQGDAKSFKHKGWSDILSWNWGLTSNRKSAQNLETDKTSLNELSIIKHIGNDSPGIRLLFAEGTTIANVSFTIFPPVGKREAQKSYVDIFLEGVMVKSIVTGGNTDDDFFKEHITLLYEKVKFEYCRHMLLSTETIEDIPETQDFEWNVPDNIEWTQ